MKFAIIGLGGRGRTYAEFIKEYGENIVAVCDSNPQKLALAKQFGVDEKHFYTNEEEFFNQGKIADALIIATMDDLHYRQTIKALDLGYDILLEKPIGISLSECEQIEQKAIETGRKVCVCHVLRYSPFYKKIKDIIDDKTFGELVSISMVENIGYYHYAHSFVRGNWRNDRVATPLIVQKNCHDLDIICWFMNSPVESVSSIGNLFYFKKENAPLGASDYCYECKYKDTCKWSGYKIYNNEKYESIAGLSKHGNIGDTKEERDKTLQDKSNKYSRCVFACDNNVCDHEIVNLYYKNGVCATLNSIAFTEKLGRDIVVNFTDGRISGTDNGKILYEKFGGESGEIEVDYPKGGYGHHAGGDAGIVKEFIDYVGKGIKTKSITDISVSVLSHKIAFLADQSRKENGKVYLLK